MFPVLRWITPWNAIRKGDMEVLGDTNELGGYREFPFFAKMNQKCAIGLGSCRWGIRTTHLCLLRFLFYSMWNQSMVLECCCVHILISNCEIKKVVTRQVFCLWRDIASDRITMRLQLPTTEEYWLRITNSQKDGKVLSRIQIHLQGREY